MPPVAQKEEAPIITSGRKGQSKSIKIILIILGILLLVVVSETAYYFYSKGSFRQAQESKSTRSISQPTPISTQKPTASFIKSFNVEKVKAFAANFETLKSKESFFDKVTINIFTTGEVISAYPEKIEINGIEYTYTIKLKNAVGQTLTNRFTQGEVVNTYAVLVGPNTQKEIKIKQIQTGDRINIKETIDLLDDNPHSKVILEVRR